MPHLHVGVKISDLLDFNQLIISNSFNVPIVDGDGWPVWGERPGSENNPSDVLHVIIRVRGTKTAADLIRILPPTVPLPNGTLAILTEADDWNKVILTHTAPLTPAQQELQEALDILKYYADGLANEYSGEAVANVLAVNEAAYHTLKDALNL